MGSPGTLRVHGRDAGEDADYDDDVVVDEDVVDVDNDDGDSDVGDDEVGDDDKSAPVQQISRQYWLLRHRHKPEP